MKKFFILFCSLVILFMFAPVHEAKAGTPSNGSYYADSGHEYRIGMLRLQTNKDSNGNWIGGSGEPGGENLSGTKPNIDWNNAWGLFGVSPYVNRDWYGFTHDWDGWSFVDAVWLDQNVWNQYAVWNNYYDEYQNTAPSNGPNFFYGVGYDANGGFVGGSGVHNKYARWVACIFSRPLPNSKVSENYLNLDSVAYYGSGETLWVKPETQTWVVSGYGTQDAVGSGVQSAQWDPAARISTQQVTSFQGTWINFNRNSRSSDGAQWNSLQYPSGESYISNFYGRGVFNDNIGGFSRNLSGSVLQFWMPDGTKAHLSTNSTEKYGNVSNTSTWFGTTKGGSFDVLASDGRAPTIANAWIDGTNRFGYSLHIRGVSDNGGSGVKYVKVPTWTENNGQDDIIWYTVYPDGNGNIDMWIPASDHNNETGHYFSHIYTYDNVGNQSPDAVKALDTWVTPKAINNGTWIQDDEYRDANGKIWVQQGNPFTLNVNGYTEYYDYNQQINSVFALIRDDSWNQTYFNVQIGNNQTDTWNGYTNRNDLGLSRYNGHAWRANNWTAGAWNMSINQDNKTIYAYPLLRVYRNGDTSDDNNITAESTWWEDGKGASITSDGTAPTATGMSISNITTDGYDVTVTGVTDGIGSGVNRVQFPTWTDNNSQDDIQPNWDTNSLATGQNLGNGTWKYHVKITDHKNETGVYHTHVYAWDNVGNYSVLKTDDNIVVPLWTNPSTVANGVWVDNNGSPAGSVYTSLNGNKWVKPNQTFFISTIGKSNSPDQQVDEDHLFVYNANNTSEQQTVKSGAVRHQLWTTSYWQDSSPLNSIQFVNGYGAARRNDDLSFNKDGDLLESYFKMKLLTDNTDYYQGSRALCLDGGRYYWSNNANFDIYNIIRTDGTAPSVTFTPNGSGWTNATQNVLINVSDLRSGVQNWRYSLSSDNGTTWGAWSSYITGAASQNVPITQQGQWKIKVESTDNVGNTGTIISNVYLLDLTNPSGIFTSNSNNWSNNNVNVYFDPSDTGGSGVNKWRYKISLDSGTTWGTWSAYINGDNASYIPLTTAGEIRVLAEVTDVAGNVGTVTSPIYSLPVNSKPIAQFTVTTPKLTNDILTYNDTSTANDAWDAITQREWSYSFDGRANTDPYKTWTTPTATPQNSFDLSQFASNLEKGTYQVRLRVKDTGNYLSPALWSDYCYRDVVIYRINTKPKVSFTVTPMQFMGDMLTYSVTTNPNDAWDSITTYEWSYSSDNGTTWSSPTATAPNSFAQKANYKIRVRVLDKGNLLSPALWSDYYVQDVSIIYPLTLINYRIVDIVNPPTSYTYPIYTASMPTIVKAGYRVTFEVDVVGIADSIPVDIYINGNKTTTISMKKKNDTNLNFPYGSVWTFDYVVPVDTPDNSIVNCKFKGFNTAHNFTFDYNTFYSWNGDSLKTKGSYYDDFTIRRSY